MSAFLSLRPFIRQPDQPVPGRQLEWNRIPQFWWLMQQRTVRPTLANQKKKLENSDRRDEGEGALAASVSQSCATLLPWTTKARMRESSVKASTHSYIHSFFMWACSCVGPCAPSGTYGGQGTSLFPLSTFSRLLGTELWFLGLFSQSPYLLSHLIGQHSHWRCCSHLKHGVYKLEFRQSKNKLTNKPGKTSKLFLCSLRNKTKSSFFYNISFTMSRI